MEFTKKSISFSLLLILILVGYGYFVIPSVIGWGPSSYYENVSVMTTVNITDAYPELLDITCNGGSDVTLNAGTTKIVSCLLELRDYNGGNTIDHVNATFYHEVNLSDDPDDNNTHYTNLTCVNISSNGFDANWTCNFSVLYYANNGTWFINASIEDDYGLSIDSDETYSTSILSLYALNVTEVIDFGDMAVGETTLTPVETNITNFGNMDINISLYAFGGNDSSVPGATTVAMFCDVRNISLSDERYALNASEVHLDMTPVTGPPAITLTTLTIPQQTNDQQVEYNSTYWSLYIDPSVNPFGVCNGTVVFAAEVP